MSSGRIGGPMAEDRASVTDQEIQEIIDAGEAGVGDLLEVFERVEATYYSSLAPSPVVNYIVGTTTAA